MKRILTLLLVLCMVLTLLPAASLAAATEVTSGTCGENLTWKLEDGILTISGTGDMEDYTIDSFAPWAEYSESITSLVISEGVTSLGAWAFFDCPKLAEVSIAKTVNSLGGHVFQSCSALTAIELPNGLTSIPDYAFFRCSSLADLGFPAAITDIGVFAFNACDSLKAVEIPNTVSTIASYAFCDCANLAKVTMSNTVTKLGEAAFQGCVSLSNVILSEGLTSIEMATFFGCTSLSAIVIPNGITVIGSDAFGSCENLNEVIVPRSVSEIEGYAFAACPSLKNLKFQGDAPVFNPGVFYDSTVTAWYPVDNDTWTDEILNQDYGANVTWVSYSDLVPEEPACTLDELTELDYLAFSKLAYSDLENYPIGTTVKNILGSAWDNPWPDAPEFLNSEIYGGISGWKLLLTDPGTDGYYAAAFENGKGDAVIAYRGSEALIDAFKGSEDASADWWENDLPMLLTGKMGTQFPQTGITYIKVANNESISNIVTTGHSLGGAWANVISALYGCKCVSMNAVPIIDVAYDEYPKMFGFNFAGVDKWNFIDHANSLDIWAGMNESLFSTASLKPYIRHKNMSSSLSMTDPHTLWSLVERKSDGSVGLSEVNGQWIPDEAILQTRKISSVYLGSSLNDNMFEGSISPLAQTAYGGDGYDWINTGIWGDILVGGGYYDELDGSRGDDSYYYFKGDGLDTIHDISGDDTLYLCGFDDDDVIQIYEDLFTDPEYIIIEYDDDTIVKISKVNREYSLGTFDSFKIVIDFDGRSETHDITEAFDEDKLYSAAYQSHMYIGCPVDVQILDADGNVVYTLKDGEVGNYYTEYGNFYIFEEADGGYGKVLDLKVGYFVNVVGMDDGTMDITYYPVTDGELGEVQTITDIPVTDTFETAVVEKEDGTLWLESNCRGDFTGDAKVDEADVAQLLWHILFPDQYEITGDADFTGDGSIDEADVAYLLWHTLFPETYPL